MGRSVPRHVGANQMSAGKPKLLKQVKVCVCVANTHTHTGPDSDELGERIDAQCESKHVFYR